MRDFRAIFAEAAARKGGPAALEAMLAVYDGTSYADLVRDQKEIEGGDVPICSR